MAAPITWRNVSAGNAAVGSNLLNQGTADINKAFLGLRDLADDQRTENINQQNTLIDTNTADISARIKALGSVDDYNAALKQGVFSKESLDKEFGKGNYNINKITSAFEQHDNDLMQQEADTFAYQERKRKQADAPLLAQFNARLNEAQNPSEVRSILKDLPEELSAQGVNTLTSTGRALQRDLYGYNQQVVEDTRKEQRYQAQENLKRMFSTAVRDKASGREAYKKAAKNAGIKLYANDEIVPYKATTAQRNAIAQRLGLAPNSPEVKAAITEYENTETEKFHQTLEREANNLAELAQSSSEFSERLYNLVGNGYEPEDVEFMVKKYQTYQTNLQRLPVGTQERINKESADFNTERDVAINDAKARINLIDQQNQALIGMEVEDLKMTPNEGIQYFKENVLKGYGGNDTDLEQVVSLLTNELTDIKDVTGADIKAFTQAVNINPSLLGTDADFDADSVAKIIQEFKVYKEQRGKQIEGYLKQKAQLNNLIIGYEKEKVNNMDKLTNDARLRHTALSQSLY